MNEAKMVWLLSNGEYVAIGDNVKVDTGDEICFMKVTDIGETYITGESDKGGEMDFYFSDIDDVEVVK